VFEDLDGKCRKKHNIKGHEWKEGSCSHFWNWSVAEHHSNPLEMMLDLEEKPTSSPDSFTIPHLLSKHGPDSHSQWKDGSRVGVQGRPKCKVIGRPGEMCLWPIPPCLHPDSVFFQFANPSK
jgi:hypothetical protein